MTPALLPAQDADIVRYFKWGYEDAWHMAKEVSGKDVLVVAGIGAALVPLSLLDEPLADAAYREYEGTLGSAISGVNELPFVFAGISASAALMSLGTNNRTLKDAAFTSLQSGGYTLAVTYFLKTVIGRQRPFSEKGAHTFAPFSGLDLSFPSGHTSLMFALVTPWVMYYPNPFTYGLWVVSAGTGFARMAKNRHWFTDVIAGGLIGTGFGVALSHRHQASEEHLSFHPALSGFQFTFRF